MAERAVSTLCEKVGVFAVPVGERLDISVLFVRDEPPPQVFHLPLTALIAVVVAPEPGKLLGAFCEVGQILHYLVL